MKTAANTAAGGLTGREISELSSVEAIDLLCAKKLTAVQYATTLLERATTYQCINSFAFLDSEKVSR